MSDGVIRELPETFVFRFHGELPMRELCHSSGTINMFPALGYEPGSLLLNGFSVNYDPEADVNDVHARFAEKPEDVTVEGIGGEVFLLNPRSLDPWEWLTHAELIERIPDEVQFTP